MHDLRFTIHHLRFTIYDFRFTIYCPYAEHLRQHERVTAEDREAEQRARAFHLGHDPPKITHLIAEQLPK
ncbi:MAG TPA: hypothetical protein DC047_03775 [Blastocatellia bacterium]|nr:hypothetical protein [Blastocatellia bacterium]